MDPKTEDYMNLSPYNYVANNPMLFIDPNGMDLDNYGVDDMGYIEFLEETEDDYDVLYTVDDEGNKLDTSGDNEIAEEDGQVVEKGVLDKVKTGTDSEGNIYDFMNVQNDKTSTELFEFLANNTKVEWSQVKFGTKSNYISTGHLSDAEPGGADLTFNLLRNNYTVREFIHSHPSRNGGKYTNLDIPSGYHYLDKNLGDRAFALWINKYYPNKGIKLKLYSASTKSYIRYDAYGYSRED